MFYVHAYMRDKGRVRFRNQFFGVHVPPKPTNSKSSCVHIVIGLKNEHIMFFQKKNQLMVGCIRKHVHENLCCEITVL